MSVWPVLNFFRALKLHLYDLRSSSCSLSYLSAPSISLSALLILWPYFVELCEPKILRLIFTSSCSSLGSSRSLGTILSRAWRGNMRFRGNVLSKLWQIFSQKGFMFLSDKRFQSYQETSKEHFVNQKMTKGRESIINQSNWGNKKCFFIVTTGRHK